jgi:cystathionine beta-synthase
LIDEWLKTNDSEAFAMTKRIMRVLSYAHIYIGLTRCSRTEGLFVGGSSGSALSGALRYLQSPSGQSIATDPTANVVVILPDGVRNYMSKTWFLDQADEPATAELRATIRGVLGRELGEPGKEKVEIEGGEEGKIEADDTEIGGLLEKALDGIGAGITTHGKLPVGWTNPAALGV